MSVGIESESEFEGQGTRSVGIIDLVRDLHRLHRTRHPSHGPPPRVIIIITTIIIINLEGRGINEEVSLAELHLDNHKHNHKPTTGTGTGTTAGRPLLCPHAQFSNVERRG